MPGKAGIGLFSRDRVTLSHWIALEISTYYIAPWYSCVCGTIVHVNSTLINKMNKFEKCQWLHFTQNWLLFLVISISHVFTNYPKLVKIWLNTKSWCLIKILPFSLYAQNTEHFTSVDSPSWAEQIGANKFDVACTAVEINRYILRLSKAFLLWPCMVGRAVREIIEHKTSTTSGIESSRMCCCILANTLHRVIMVLKQHWSS